MYNKIQSHNSTTEGRKTHQTQLRHTLKKNDFPPEVVKKLTNKCPTPIRKQPYIFTGKFTYRKGLFEKIKRTCEKYQIRLAPELGNKIKNFLPPLKQKEKNTKKKKKRKQKNKGEKKKKKATPKHINRQLPGRKGHQAPTKSPRAHKF